MKEAVSQQTDDKLLRSIQVGDRKAFDGIVLRYQKPLFTYLVRFVGDSQIAEDIFQDTFLKAISGWKDYREQGKLGNWLFGIAHHLAIDYLRKEKRHRKLFSIHDREPDGDNEFEIISDFDQMPDKTIEQQELKQILNSAINKLSIEQKDVFLLREHSDLTFKEIAALLNRPLSTVLAQMRYALQNLRKVLTKEYHGEISHVLQ
ncbi:sigma-70 family RNA polymerase sigma factor [candidate division KSB1 bacterium]|nr:sigma-70 family RNA polymerase sigma factor [candidate division KSB1 bacterium]